LVIDFGDKSISSENHATLTYDAKNRRFFLGHGTSKNLTYLGNDPVLSPVELTGHENIMIGDTRLMFVPFCGADFAWDSE
jgi:hypothetical protein